ncbi:uncharacterized protein BJX67DRAFT_198116 [Aspergillus lucknowensis]|uniref:Uncharacterized protein n=1 Tax=Aspergillus lucknowensis TaxID=176173 RepID=A0ABR4LJN1_9EURO
MSIWYMVLAWKELGWPVGFRSRYFPFALHSLVFPHSAGLPVSVVHHLSGCISSSHPVIGLVAALVSSSSGEGFRCSKFNIPLWVVYESGRAIIAFILLSSFHLSRTRFWAPEGHSSRHFCLDLIWVPGKGEQLGEQANIERVLWSLI